MYAITSIVNPDRAGPTYRSGAGPPEVRDMSNDIFLNTACVIAWIASLWVNPCFPALSEKTMAMTHIVRQYNVGRKGSKTTGTESHVDPRLSREAFRQLRDDEYGQSRANAHNETWWT